MDHQRIALLLAMRAFRTGRAWQETINFLQSFGLVQQRLGLPPVETDEFQPVLDELEAEWTELLQRRPDLAAGFPVPADPDPATPPRRRFS
jgi:hypothetical protein